MTKRFSLALLSIAVLALLVLPAMSVPVIPSVPQGGDVFIGEQGLDVSAAIGNATAVAWWQSGTNPSTDVPNKMIQVSNPADFYVAPSDFVGKTGNWYQLDANGKSQGIVAFVVNDPSIDVKVWDQNSQKDVTGQSIPTGDYLNFRVETNLNNVEAQRGASTGFVTIKVKTADGAVYDNLYQADGVTLPLADIAVNAQPYYWVPVNDATQGWWTGYTDSTGNKLYKAGTYTVTAESNLNSMKDNYKDASGNDYTGKTISATKTVVITSDSINIEVTKDSVVRGNPFSVTVKGRPNEYYYMWVKGTSSMKGTGDDQPPQVGPNQDSVWYPGGTLPSDFQGAAILDYQFQNGGGRTIGQDVPAVQTEDPASYNYAALVKTSNGGTRTVEWQTTRDTNNKKYTIRVERQNLEDNTYKSDEVDVKIEKGAVTVVASGSQSYYLGQEIKLTGTNSETSTSYLFITGPNLPSSGGKLETPRDAVVSGDAATFTTADVLDDNTWEFKWQTSNIAIDAGTYTIYAVSSPNNKNDLGNAQYGTVSVIVRKPFVSASADSGDVARGDNDYIRGTAEGKPSDGVAIWILGKNFVAYSTESVNDDGSFEYEIKDSVTRDMSAGQYFVVVQHPMYNDKFDVFPNADNTLVQGSYPTDPSTKFTLSGAGSLQGSDAAEALVAALTDPAVDDTYTKLQFMIEEPTIRIAPIGEKMVGDKFSIDGTTNLKPDDEILVEVTSSSFKPTDKSQSGEFSGATGTVKVQKGTEGFNTWNFSVDSSTFKPDEYIVKAQGVVVDSATATQLFNVVESGATPSTTATTAPAVTTAAVTTAVTTAAVTTAETTVATTVPTTVPTTKSPGFGALLAMIGLGAVALFVVRRH